MDAGITEKEAVAMHQPILIRIGCSAFLVVLHQDLLLS
jgi:hypothetical protein